MSEVRTPFEAFRDADGTPLDGGYVYVGIENQEPITHPALVFWDADLTIAAAQPIRTIGGYPVRAGAPAKVYTSGGYSICVKNKNGEIIVSAVSSGSLEALLADATSAARGAGMMGYGSTVPYPEGSIGHAVQTSAPSSVPTYAEIQEETYTAFVAGGTAPAFELTPSPAVSSLTTQAFVVTFAADGTTGSNTLNVSGLGAVALKQCGSSGALVDGVVKNGFIAKIKYNGTYWVILNPLQPQAAHGNCVLVLSAGSLVLKPWRGNGLIINGATCTIPSTGVSLAVTGMTAGTLYYVYAYMNSGTMTLEAVTTAHTTGADGVEVKSGDTSRTLVGMARPVAGPAFSAASNAMFVRSWFNRSATERRPRSLQAAAISTTSISYVEVGTTTRVEWLQWSDEVVKLTGYPCIKHVNPGTPSAKLVIDGNDIISMSPSYEKTTGSNSYVYNVFGAPDSTEAASLPTVAMLDGSAFVLAEGYHYSCVQIKGGNDAYLDADSTKTYGNTEVILEKL